MYLFTNSNINEITHELPYNAIIHEWQYMYNTITHKWQFRVIPIIQ
jgi:phosphoribosylformylglycinamidine (FGAM) synthase PurS component